MNGMTMNAAEALTNNPEGRELIDVSTMDDDEPRYALGMTPAEREEADRRGRAAYMKFQALWRAQPWYVKWWRRVHGENHA